MPLDTTSSRKTATVRVTTLNDAERRAAGYFGPRLREALSQHPTHRGSTVVLADFSASLGQAGLRLVPALCASALRRPGEIELATLPLGVPDTMVARSVLAAKLTSAAAGAWRQRYHMERLGFLPSQAS